MFLNISGDFTLDINPVLLEDDADFQCQVGATREVTAIRSADAHLTVTVKPDKPVIYNGKQINTVETRTVKIRCASVGGKPVAEVRNLFGQDWLSLQVMVNRSTY